MNLVQKSNLNLVRFYRDELLEAVQNGKPLSVAVSNGVRRTLRAQNIIHRPTRNTWSLTEYGLRLLEEAPSSA